MTAQDFFDQFAGGRSAVGSGAVRYKRGVFCSGPTNSSGMTLSGTVVNGVTVTGAAVYSDGVASDFTVAAGTVTVSRGGKLVSPVIGGGTVTVSSGGRISCSEQSAGVTNVSSGGRWISGALHAGFLNLDQATVSAVSISGGTVSVGGDCALTDCEMRGGVISGYATRSVFSNFIMTGGSARISGYFDKIKNCTILGGALSVSSGARIDDSNIVSCDISIDAGGVVQNTSCIYTVFASAGATVNNVNFAGDTFYIWSNCIVSGLAASAGVVVMSSAKVNVSGLVITAGAKMILPPLIAGDTLTFINGSWSGGAFTLTGGVASNCPVFSDFHVRFGGVATGCTVCSGGRMYVSAGGSAVAPVLLSGGVMFISAGGSAFDVVSSGGTVYYYA